MTLHTMFQTPPSGVSDLSESAARYFAAISGAISAELLENRSVSLPGFGSFFVQHLPARQQIGGGGRIYLPPRNRIIFEKRLDPAPDFCGMLSSRLSLQCEDLAAVVEHLPDFLERKLREEGEISFPGFGTLVPERGGCHFTVDGRFDELLNREYGNLQAISLSSPGRGRLVKPAAIAGSVVAVALVMAGAALFFGQRSSFRFSVPEHLVVQPPRGSEVVAEVRERASGSLSGSSMLLEAGEYTVVLATFRKKQTAERELSRLRVPGTSLFIWPVTGKGRQYYRLAAGRFTTLARAKSWMDSLGLGRKGSCIQQAKRRVELHAEKGL